jgi:hypothetical protein
MSFDIHQDIYGPDWFIDEKKAERYKKRLLELFEKSPEWKSARQDTDSDDPMWSDMFLNMVLFYIGQPLFFVNSTTLREALYDILPQKVIVPAAEAPNIIRELKAFWTFIKREYDLPHADSCLKVLNQKTIISRLEKEMSDSSKFGMAKSIMMQALDAGVDITDQAKIDQFIEQYNQQIADEMAAAAAPLSDSIQQKLDEIIAIFEPICRVHINQEYADVSKRLAEEVALLHPSPLASGRARSWAAGIVYAIGRVNFLFDPSQTPHLKATELCDLFGVSQNTASAKSKDIMDTLDIFQLHPEWTLPSKMDDNPLTWMLTVNGMVVDIRYAPREVQEEAFRLGLIPYIPADGEQSK